MSESRQTSTALHLVPAEFVERRIYLIRGRKVMLDADLAELYEVETKNVNKAVRRNFDRFPEDFMFQLNKEEFENLRFQFGTSSWGGRRYLPYAFTEHGVAMLSSVLSSQRAVQMNILIIRAFIKLREMLASHKDIARKIEDLERQQREHGEQLDAVYSIVTQLIEPPVQPKRRIGFPSNNRA
jgi:phage regulator Rha-like protein